MADIKVSELPDANDFDGTELLLVVQSATSKTDTLNKVLEFIVSRTSYSEIIGDGSSINIVVTHDLGTRNVQTSVRRSTSPYDQVMVDNEATTADSVTFKFGAIAPSADQFVATISL